MTISLIRNQGCFNFIKSTDKLYISCLFYIVNIVYIDIYILMVIYVYYMYLFLVILLLHNKSLQVLVAPNYNH